MNHKLIGGIFAVLYFLCVIPFPFTQGTPIYLFGWLLLPLAYWWILMVVNLLFVLWVCKCFVDSNKRKGEEEE